MLGKGFIKIDRKITTWRWYQDANTFRVFFHLLLTANYEDRDFEDITVRRGQRVASRATLARELSISEQNVKTALKHLELTNEITSTATKKYTVFTIKNYEKYQAVTNRITNDQPTPNQQLTNDQPQCKKDKERKRKIKNSVCVPDTPHTEQKPSIPSPKEIAEMASKIGAAWDEEEISRFLEYNRDKGRTSGWMYAVKRWEARRKKFEQKESEPLADDLSDYESMTNRFRKE